MANTRPIRRGRIPFRRRGRWLSKALHPVRWLDCNSSSDAVGELSPCGTTIVASLCDPTSPTELLVGDLDWDWSDASEVRIDRIVGTLSWSLRAKTDADDASLENGAAFIMRFGILATEETDRVYQTIDLFDPEALEEFEWMWLGQHTIGLGEPSSANAWHTSQATDIPLDVRTRRKLGKKDSIILYSQTRLMTTGSPVITWSSNLAWQLRAIIRS